MTVRAGRIIFVDWGAAQAMRATSRAASLERLTMPPWTIVKEVFGAALIVLMLLADAGLVSVAHAQSYTIYGRITCGAIVSDWESGNIREQKFDAFWILGFISGAGYKDAKQKGLNSDGIMLWVRQYCVAHPLEDGADAAAALLDTLKWRRAFTKDRLQAPETERDRGGKRERKGCCRMIESIELFLIGVGNASKPLWRTIDFIFDLGIAVFAGAVSVLGAVFMMLSAARAEPPYDDCLYESYRAASGDCVPTSMQKRPLGRAAGDPGTF
jgi:hypothetical protein